MVGDYQPGIFKCSTGHQCVDLTGQGFTGNFSGGTATGIEQRVPTTPGDTYLLTFFVGNLYDPQGLYGTTSTVRVMINGTEDLSVTNRSKDRTSYVWMKFTTTLKATSSQTSIAFINGDPAIDSWNGLDDVSLVAVSPAGPSAVSPGSSSGGGPSGPVNPPNHQLLRQWPRRCRRPLPRSPHRFRS